MNVSVRDMKNRLSKYLKLVRAGQDFIITDRGRPVARLTVVNTGATSLAEASANLDALPWVVRGKNGPIKGLRDGIALKGQGASAAEIVLEDRD
jgi:prevent-host-death family protein